MVNQLRLNLAPGASLTNTVVITNPPPRFRLKVLLRDLLRERWNLAVNGFLPHPLASRLQKWRENAPPASAWIETKLSEQGITNSSPAVSPQ